jgi:glycosyltransferase involved in cell wall biosynthesis
MSDLGVIAIGRNERERLRRCLNSIAGLGVTLVYVDSGSTGGSIELARGLGVEVVKLDLSRPFSAAHARIEELERLVNIDSNARFVQFVDGDCEVVGEWLEQAQ